MRKKKQIAIGKITYFEKKTTGFSEKDEFFGKRKAYTKPFKKA